MYYDFVVVNEDLEKCISKDECKIGASNLEEFIKNGKTIGLDHLVVD